MSNQNGQNDPSERTDTSTTAGRTGEQWFRIRALLKAPMQLLAVVLGQILGHLARWALQQWMG